MTEEQIFFLIAIFFSLLIGFIIGGLSCTYVMDDEINSLKKFCEVELGKGAIVCNDTPGFLGNRIGVYAMQVAMT